MAGLAPSTVLRKRYGITAKDGSSRDLPVLPRSHPLAAKFAATALQRSRSLLDSGAFDEAAIAKQVRKANLVLYGKATPTAAEKAAARKKRLERDVAYHFGESTSAPDAVLDDAEDLPTSTREALRVVRESGKTDAHAYRALVGTPLREATANADGTIDVMVIRVGDGNPSDKNYYGESFIDSVVGLLEGCDSFGDHESLSDAKDLPERSIFSKIGFFSNPWKGPFTDPGIIGAPTVPAAYAKFHPRAGDPVVESIYGPV